MLKRLSLSILSVLTLSACAIGTNLAGPGLTETGRIAVAGEGPIYVAVTEAVVKTEAEARAEFFELSGALVESLETADGYIGHALRIDLGGTRSWTMTLWEDAGAMTVFNFSARHQAAIGRTAELLNGGRTASTAWPREAPLPTWDDAIVILDEKGRSIR